MTDTCYATACTLRESCTLWHQALDALEAGQTLLGVINPRLIEEAGGYDHCPAYYEHKLRRYARGLIWRYPEMTGTQLAAVHSALEELFGYSQTVRLRCGYEVISPEEQVAIAELFARLAPGHAPEYKAFEEHYTKPARVEGKQVHRLLR